MRRIQSEIDINASAEQVWQVLTDFPAFPQWNPFLVQVVGELRQGAGLELEAQLSGARPTRFHATVLVAEAGKELRWKGQLPIPGLFAGEHAFAIEALQAKRVRFRQWEVFTGLLIPLMRGTIGKAERGFEEMNRALKERAEQAAIRASADTR